MWILRPAPKVVSQVPRNAAFHPSPDRRQHGPSWNPCTFQGGEELKQMPWAAPEAGSANRNAQGIGVRGESLGRGQRAPDPSLGGDQVLGATLGLTH